MRTPSLAGCLPMTSSALFTPHRDDATRQLDDGSQVAAFNQGAAKRLARLLLVE